MNTRQQGFTLVELVVVIVILGILAATAVPKFVDMSKEAGNAASDGVAGALASATSANYAAKLVGNTSAVAITGASSDVCKKAILGGFVNGITLKDSTGASSSSTEYNISDGSGTCAAGAAITCTIQGSKGDARSATIICTGT